MSELNIMGFITNINRFKNKKIKTDQVGLIFYYELLCDTFVFVSHPIMTQEKYIFKSFSQTCCDRHKESGPYLILFQLVLMYFNSLECICIQNQHWGYY